jgi:hypothetical protein
MKVKGTAVSSIPAFIKKEFPNRYEEWVALLPPESEKYFKGILITGAWYPLNETLTVPLKITSKLFYAGNNEKTARDMGKFSANEALSGVYRFFIKLGTPKFLIERAGSLMRTYFDPSGFNLIQESPKQLKFIITEFPESDEIIEWNIAGWIEQALTISGCQNTSAKVVRSISRGAKETEIDIKWD